MLRGWSIAGLGVRLAWRVEKTNCNELDKFKAHRQHITTWSVESRIHGSPCRPGHHLVTSVIKRLTGHQAALVLNRIGVGSARRGSVTGHR